MMTYSCTLDANTIQRRKNDLKEKKDKNMVFLSAALRGRAGDF